MRVGVRHGNGYQCDVCTKKLLSEDVIRVKSFINIDSTGYTKTVDVIGVCNSCYKKHFPLLYNRGLARYRH